jgi:translation initiation factor 2B subunit (eIF-2B alpha/beta/delta family)
VDDLPAELAVAIYRIASDRESGASDILDAVIEIFREQLRATAPIVPAARALCRAQPSMAPVWNASIQAIAAIDDPDRFERFAQRAARSAAALTRYAVECLRLEVAGGPLRLVTLSNSRTVRVTLEALRRERTLHVACSESRPALEGRRLAVSLAESGIAVTCFADTALGHALAGAHAVLVGADAVAPDWFLNKSGTRMLAAAAAQQGLPVYALATREKFVTPALGARLVLTEGAAADIWLSPPSGIEVRNPYFERTPLELITAVISDAGLLGPTMVAAACEASQDARSRHAFEQLTA